MLSFLLGFVACYSFAITLAYFRLPKQMLKQLDSYVPAGANESIIPPLDSRPVYTGFSQERK